MAHHRPRLALLVACASIAVGCSLSPRPDPSTFFMLTTIELPDAPAAASWNTVLGIGPVTIPGYLDRPQLVTRVESNEVRLSGVARWAEPLREGVLRVLRQDLLVASGARSVVLYPWSAGALVEVVVAVDLLGFEPDARGNATLVARWSVREAAHGAVRTVRESHLSKPANGKGTGAEVAALSQALAALAGEIAVTVRELTPAPSRERAGPR